MVSIGEYARLAQQFQRLPLVFDESSCVHTRHQKARCKRCVEVCPANAIAVSGNDVSLDLEPCTGCGACAAVCPTNALALPFGQRSKTVAKSVEASGLLNGHSVIACEKLLSAVQGMVDLEKVAAVPCLGAIDVALPIELAARQVATMTCVHKNCADCENRVAFEAFASMRHAFETLVEAWRIPLSMKVTDKLPKGTRLEQVRDYDERKRRFFSDVGREAKSAAAMTADFAIKDALAIEEEERPRFAKVDAKGNLPHKVPERRASMMANLGSFGRPASEALPAGLWGKVTIDVDACMSCRACATFCPTGALFKFHTKKGVIGVKQRPEQCVDCALCQDVCPHQALRLDDRIRTEDLLLDSPIRIPLSPPSFEMPNEHAILHRARSLFTVDQVYER